jgi:hypothetical protein
MIIRLSTKLIINSDVLISLAIYSIWIAAVFDPIGKIIGARYFALASIYFLITIFFIIDPDSFKSKKLYWLVFSLFFLVLPGYGLLLSLLRGGLSSDFRDTSYIAAGILFGCSIIYLKEKFFNIGVKALIFALRLLCIAIIITWFIYLNNYSLDYIYFFVTNEAAYLGNREYGGYSFYYLYFIASPMLIYLIVYDAWRLLERPSFNILLLLFLAVIALFLSGTRINMFFAVFACPFVFIWRRFFTPGIFLLPLFLIFFIIYFNIYPIDIFVEMFSSNEHSNSVKLSLLEGYGVIFEDPLNLFFGQGFNAHVWSFEFSKMVGDASKVELTYIEMVRVFGVPITVLFFALFLIMIYNLKKVSFNYRWFAPALFLYLIMSALNPYIFSSNGMLPIGLIAALLGRNILYPRDGKPVLGNVF